MTVRVTTFQNSNNFIDLINNSRSRLEETRSQISTGLRVSKPSDDAKRAATIVGFQSSLQRVAAHQERIGFAENFLASQESAVQSAENIVIRLKELGTQGANGSVSAEVKEGIAKEVFLLRDSLAQLANTKNQGLFIFGGQADGSATAPFTLNESYFAEPTGAASAKQHWVFSDQAGARLTRNVAISESESLEINSTGVGIFENAINAATRLGRALSGFQTFPDTGDADSDGNTTELLTTSPAQLTLPADSAVQQGEINAAIDALDVARVNDVENELSNIGAKVNKLQQTNEILEQLQVDTNAARSSIQDTDLFAAANTFANLQTNLEALLSSGARINNLSLLNFI